MTYTPNRLSLALYTGLMKVRPAQLADALKRALWIRRKEVADGAGHVFWVDPVSIFGIKLLRGATHEPGLTRIIHRLLRPGDVFLDVGGNEGYYSILASGRVGKAGQVHCIEPQSRLLPVLSRNMALNESTAMRVHHLALSDNEGSVRLFLRPSINTGASSLMRHWRLGGAYEEVPAVTLDGFCRENGVGRIRLMKVDCEGAEHLTVAGGHGVLSGGRIDFVALEYHPHICGEARCEETHRALSGHRYVCSEAAGHRVYHRPELAGELQAVGEVRAGCQWR